MKKKEISRIFAEIAYALEFKGDNRFKVISYRKASRILKDLGDDTEILAKNGKLREIHGIGEGVAKKI
jgi:DNA polymerase (family 10)